MTKNNELEDALFAFGRNYNEVKEPQMSSLPKGISELINSKNEMDKVALETGFIIRDINRKVKQNGWFRFEQVMSVKLNLLHMIILKEQFSRFSMALILLS